MQNIQGNGRWKIQLHQAENDLPVSQEQAPKSTSACNPDLAVKLNNEDHGISSGLFGNPRSDPFGSISGRTDL